MADEQWETYSQYRNQLVSSLQASYEHFDKAILTLAGGGLALSIAFIEKIAPLAQAKAKCVLVASWFFLCFAILCNLISFLLSQLALRCQIEYADKGLGCKQEEYLTKRNPFSIWVTGLNWAAAIWFVVAVLGIAVFAAINVF